MPNVISVDIAVHGEGRFIPFDDIPNKSGLAGCKQSAECFLSWIVFWF